jgi:hypothetical protein
MHAYGILYALPFEGWGSSCGGIRDFRIILAGADIHYDEFEFHSTRRE